MNESSKPWNDAFHENVSAYGLEFPVEAGFRDRPPRGSVEDGVKLSLSPWSKCAIGMRCSPSATSDGTTSSSVSK